MRTAAQNLAAIPATREGLAALPTYRRDPAALRVGRGPSFLDQLRAQQMFGPEALARSRQPNFIDQAQANARQAATDQRIQQMFGTGPSRTIKESIGVAPGAPSAFPLLETQEPWRRSEPPQPASNVSLASPASSPSPWTKKPPAPKPGSYGEARLRIEANQYQREYDNAVAKSSKAEYEYIVGEKSIRRNKRLSADAAQRCSDRLSKAWRLAKENENEIFRAKLPRRHALLATQNPSQPFVFATPLADTDDRVLATNEATRFISSVVDQSLLPSSTPNLFDARTAKNRSLNNRAFYDDTTEGVYLYPADGTDISVHEFGHWLEFRLPAIQQESMAYYAERTKGSPLVHLGAGYEAHEEARDGGFIDPYVGKEYVVGNKRVSTEIVSVGLEYLYRDPVALAERDPDFFDFLIATLHKQ